MIMSLIVFVNGGGFSKDTAISCNNNLLYKLIRSFKRAKHPCPLEMFIQIIDKDPMCLIKIFQWYSGCGAELKFEVIALPS